ncbi:MAG: hypothetical protein R3E97_19855 [Candidatus Eisenbacteria bacterium]
MRRFGLIGVLAVMGLSQSACTVIGYNMGKDLDARGYEWMPGATVRDLEPGWSVRVSTADSTYAGTVLARDVAQSGDFVVLQPHEGAEADTILGAEVQKLERGGQLGNPTAIGTMVGAALDALALVWIERKIDDYVRALE